MKAQEKKTPQNLRKPKSNKKITLFEALGDGGITRFNRYRKSHGHYDTYTMKKLEAEIKKQWKKEPRYPLHWLHRVVVRMSE